MVDKYLEVLAHEFSGGKGSFILQLRLDLYWDKDAFNRMTEAMYLCCKHYQYTKEQLEQEMKEQSLITEEQFEDKQFAIDFILRKKDIMLPRWLAEGFWYVPQFTWDWTSHPSWEKKRASEPDYFKKAYNRLHSLADWFFTGRSPWIDEEKEWVSTFV